MHRLRMEQMCCASTRRTAASFGKTALTHDQLLNRFRRDTLPARGELELLEAVEERLRSWRLSKWESRIPVLLSQNDKEAAQSQLHRIKTLILDQAATQGQVDADLDLISKACHTTPADVRTKNRAWLQEQVAKLRWEGEVERAREVRDAFLRLEGMGSRDFRFFERLCCIYGLAKLGTFEGAFSNYVVPRGGSIELDKRCPFEELLAVMVAKYPMLDVVHDFIGFNDLEGYRSSLAKYLTNGLEEKHARRSKADAADTAAGATAAEASPPAGGRTSDGSDAEKSQVTESGNGSHKNSKMLFQRPSPAGVHERELLFDHQVTKSALINAENGHAVADFVHVVGCDVTLLTIATQNKWLRSRQVPHPKQLEAIGRRFSFVVGAPLDAVRIRSLLLPPSYLDRSSLDRLNRHVLRMDEAAVERFAPWVALYQKELDVVRDADYMESVKTRPEEEWVKL